MPAPTLVIFDCDGVLIDSEVLSAEVLIAELAAEGIALDLDYVRAHFLGRSFPTVARTIREAFDAKLPAAFEARYRAALLDRFATDLRLTAGLLPVLDALATEACVATSSSPQRTARALEIAGLAARFEGRIFTASEVERGKPAPDLFLHAAARMGHPPERVLVIEDSAPGLIAARAAGMRALAYTGGAHMAGRLPDVGFAVPSFDNWADFPHLLTGIGRDGEGT